MIEKTVINIDDVPLVDRLVSKESSLAAALTVVLQLARPIVNFLQARHVSGSWKARQGARGLPHRRRGRLAMAMGLRARDRGLPTASTCGL
jgi:hypothetical protein